MAEVGILEPEDRVELIQGEIIQMSPIKSFHASVVDTLQDILLFFLRGKAIVRTQNPIFIDNFSEPEPDLTIAHFQPHKYRDHHPRPENVYFLIEVADTTLQKDRKLKLPLYAKAGIPEVWIVNLKKQNVELYCNLVDGTYQETKILERGEVLRYEDLGLELEVEKIFE